MHKIYKIHPSVPSRDFIHYGIFDDNCYGCHCRTKCNSCPRARSYNERKRRKAIKKMRNRNLISRDM